MSAFHSGVMIGLFALIATGIIVAILVVNRLLGDFNRQKIHDEDVPFESGLLPSSSTQRHFSISYYLIAAAFLIFELEAAILWAWAIDYWSLGISGTIAALVFMVILLLGLVYLIRKGGLNFGGK
ncbi:NADH-quinone oxidoreductase subunit A [Paraphotobacterium marinum]|uniref:NADH-quinone oxidoreductase subunit n=1 Tax=Paraphotobacterium marinum TaxID=1755811 RepID=A0A220VDC8_9GAMM|nr:NADH-quinone oxidoreductase subunit A [Paraphotobacterium marinum]ASK78404.1 NADH-quinone oxidoreductase subunit A [Paraphotobacterium marinum]